MGIYKILILPHNWMASIKNIKIYIKISPTVFGVVTPSSGSASVLAKVTLG